MPPQPNILIADDEPPILKLFDNVLRGEKYTLFYASDGEEAVEVAENHPIDLAILDLRMPKLGGMQAFKEIKTIDKNTEVLIITGQTHLKDLETAFFDYNAFDYLIKPFDTSELKITIKRALDNRALVLRNSNEKEALKARIRELEEGFKEKVFRLRECQIKYKNIVNNATDAIVIVQDNLIEFVNKRFCVLTGYSRHEIENQPLLNLVHLEDCAKHRKETTEAEQSFAHSFTAQRFRIRKKDGSFLWMDIRMVESTWKDKPADLCFLGDISQKKHMEEMMVRSEKMASLGQLSSGLAHELRNPLAVISSCTQFCLENMDVSGLIAENFEVIHRNSQRASKLIGELLAYARPDQLKFKMVDLNQLLEKMLDMAKMGSHHSDIQFIKSFQIGLPRIPADEEKIGQVCINLIQNAIQAVSPKGTITLTTGWDPTGEPKLEFSVADDGPGIAEPSQKRIFDPFFTTKEGGTGLGLSICDAIVMQHGGLIAVECEEKRSTRFLVRLPFESEEMKKSPHG